MSTPSNESLTIEQAFLIGADHHQSGRLQEAEEVYRKILAVLPRQADTHHNLGLLARQLGHDDGALPHLQVAFEEAPSNEQYLMSYAIGLLATGATARAHEILTNALQRSPTSPAVRDLFQKASELQKNTLQRGKEPSESQLRDLIDHFNSGEYEIVENKARLLLTQFPDAGLVWKALGASLQVRSLPAEVAMRKAVACLPDDAEAFGNLANELKTSGQLEESIGLYKKAIGLAPKMAILHHNLAGAFCASKDFEEGILEYRRALEIDPSLAIAHADLGSALCTVNHHQEGLVHLRAAVAADPHSQFAYSALLFSLGLMQGIGKEILFAEHQRYAELFESPLQDKKLTHRPDKNPEKRLRVGFVSGDFRHHSVANFIEPVLTHLSQSENLELFAYYNHPAEDFVSARIKKLFLNWKRVPDLTDEQLAKQILSDQIDILIDLSGHTAFHRLSTFCRKPAPLQASWIGYAGTTGLKAMDYYLADRYFLPHGQFDDQFTEKIVQLPAGAPFLPYSNAPDVNELPAKTNGYITFGNFNRPIKIRQDVISTWARLLHAVPHSKMLMAGMPTDQPDMQLSSWFKEEGIEVERLSFIGVRPIEGYLALHHQVDICLDTFPYNGGTTSWHAIWMGVPTLTLSGDTPPGRSGASILGQMGLDRFAARSKEEFVSRGVFLCSQLDELAALRTSMRQLFSVSSAGKPEVVARGVETALRTMWHRYCAGHPPTSFEVRLETARGEPAEQTSREKI
jgi:protein O-GlcNAc transferase